MSTEPQETKQTPEAAPETSAPADRPDYVPEQYWKDGAVDLEGLTASYSELSAFKAVQDERLSAIPEKPDGYSFALPEGFELPDLPEGASFELKDDDPRREPLTKWAKEAGITDGDFQKLLCIYAGHEATELKRIHESASSEMTKLGTGAQQRLTDLGKTLNSRLTKDQATALSNALTTADAVLAVEKLVQLTADRAAPQTDETAAPDMAPFGRNASERLDAVMRKGA